MELEGETHASKANVPDPRVAKLSGPARLCSQTSPTFAYKPYITA